MGTLTSNVIHLKQPLFLAKHLTVKSMHSNAQYNDQFLPHSFVGTNSYGCCALELLCCAHSLEYIFILYAPSEMSFTKRLKTHYLKILQNN